MCAVCTQAAPALALIADGWSEDGLDGYTIVAVIALIIGAVIISAIIAAHITLYKTSIGPHVGLPQGHDQHLATRLLERMEDEDSIFHGQWPHDIHNINDTSLRVLKKHRETTSMRIWWYMVGREKEKIRKNIDAKRFAKLLKTSRNIPI